MGYIDRHIKKHPLQMSEEELIALGSTMLEGYERSKYSDGYPEVTLQDINQMEKFTQILIFSENPQGRELHSKLAGVIDASTPMIPWVENKRKSSANINYSTKGLTNKELYPNKYK